MKKKPITITHIVSVGLAALIIATAYLSYQDYRHKAHIRLQDAKLEQAKTELASTKFELENTRIDRDTLARKLEEEQSRVDTLASQVDYIKGTLGLLEKIQGTDPELLQKYSRVYFLNENYTPSGLTQIDITHVYNIGKDAYFHAKVLPFLNALLDNAARANVDIKIISGYRSFGAQGELKSSYTILYGAGANQFSADQGYSEHQLGTAVDFTDSVIGASFLGFDKSKAYEWLKENAHAYGFTLSYPQNNSYYRFEPWHWRFVGKKLAERLHAESKNFHDLDQRELETYLASFFD